jgi:transcriptional regulator with XRE-family HTH domain
MRASLPKTASTTRRSEGPDPVDTHLGERLRLRRNLIGMSQGQLGSALGLTFQQIQKYERGANRIAASRLHQMAGLLGVPIGWFFEELPTQAMSRIGFSENEQAVPEGAPAPSPDAAILRRRETLDLIRAYYKISDPKQRRKVFELVKSMSDKTE